MSAFSSLCARLEPPLIDKTICMAYTETPRSRAAVGGWIRRMARIKLVSKLRAKLHTKIMGFQWSRSVKEHTLQGQEPVRGAVDLQQILSNCESTFPTKNCNQRVRSVFLLTTKALNPSEGG